MRTSVYLRIDNMEFNEGDVYLNLRVRPAVPHGKKRVYHLTWSVKDFGWIDSVDLHKVIDRPEVLNAALTQVGKLLRLVSMPN